jgi:hypothetical protein
MYINISLFTLKQSYMFQLSKGHSKGVLIQFISQVNSIPVQMSMTD